MISEQEQQIFDSIPMEEKRVRVTQLINELNMPNITKECMKLLLEELNKYKGLKLYNENETVTWLHKYMEDETTIFDAPENTIFRTQTHEETRIGKRILKCPYCCFMSNDAQFMDYHIKKQHEDKSNNKLIGFTLRYSSMMMHQNYDYDERIKCFKCDKCAFICNNKDEMYKHLSSKHHGEKCRYNKGIVGTRDKINEAAQQCIGMWKRLCSTIIKSTKEKHKKVIKEKVQRINEIKQMSQDEKINKMYEIVHNSIEKEDASIIKKYQKELKPFAGSIQPKDNEEMTIGLGAMNDLEYSQHNDKRGITEMISTITRNDTSTYCFIEAMSIGKNSCEPLIKCPYCDQCCNNEIWMKNHIRYFHKSKIFNEVGYIWTYITQNESKFSEFGSDYFAPQVCYKCSLCNFLHSNSGAVSRHFKNAHCESVGISRTVITGVAGQEVVATSFCENKFPRFNPKPIVHTNPNIYLYLRDKVNAATQTYLSISNIYKTSVLS